MVNHTRKRQRVISYPRLIVFVFVCLLIVGYVSTKTYSLTRYVVTTVLDSPNSVLSAHFTKPKWEKKIELDKKAYDEKMMYLAHRATSTLPLVASSTTALSANNSGSSTSSATSTSRASTSPITKVVSYLWPAKNTVYPNPGAILPFKRIIAYYGNLYSKKMGALGEYDADTMLKMLQSEVKKWELADPQTPVQPALHYIAVVAQGSAGKDGKYRARMPDEQIDKVLEMAKRINAIVFLDIQVALSTVQSEVPALEKYLKLPNVHLGIDPEFSMKTGKKPGSVIGTMDATDINFTAQYLAKLVRDNNLPPKVLTFYRFTRGMVTNYQNIRTLPEVQLVLVMDGWGHQARKVGTYKNFVYPEPIQFTGFKLFYKNDLKQEGGRLMTPEEVLKLTPSPIYIQYQ